MHLCNDTITVYNVHRNAFTDEDEWIGTVIDGVSWYDKYNASMTSEGLKSSESYTIRIPEDADTQGKEYIDPVQYAAQENPDAYFTLRVGDIIVKGEAETLGMRPPILHENYFKCMTILGVVDNRRAPNAPHFRINGA